MYLKIEKICKKFDELTVVNQVSVDIESNEFVCILGPSGCGKTTLLRMIAGLEIVNSGHILLDGKDLVSVPSRNREFGIVFQSYSLFPNMTVSENIGYGLLIRKQKKGDIEERVSSLLKLVDLEIHRKKYPFQLSGGQQQRVALARALAIHPKLLLLDEPLSALDAKVRSSLRIEIVDIHRKLNIPTLMVTHDQEEAMTMADKIICMNAGVVDQVGSPKELYFKPATAFVANFIGVMNKLDDFSKENPLTLQTPTANDQSIGIRPEMILLHEKGAKLADTTNLFPGVITNTSFLGSNTRFEVKLDKTQLHVEESGMSRWHNHDEVQVQLPPSLIISFAKTADGPGE